MLNMVDPDPELLEKIQDIIVPKKIESEIQHEQACEALKTVVGLKREVIATFKPIKQAQDAAKKITLDQEKKHLAPLETAETALKDIISDWRNEKQEAAEQFQQLLAENGGDTSEIAFMAPAGSPTGVVSHKSMTFTITDEMLVNRKYCTPDPVKIREAIRSLGTLAEGVVGGIKIHYESKVRVRLQ